MKIEGVQFYLRTKSALTFLGGDDSIIQVGSDSLLLIFLVFTSL